MVSNAMLLKPELPGRFCHDPRRPAALGKLVDLVQNLSGRLVLVDEGVMIFFSQKPDQRMLDTLHELSTALSESKLLPDQRTYRTLSVGYLLVSLGFLFCLAVLLLLMR